MTPKTLTDRLRRPEALLLLMAVAMPLSMNTWMALINNFSIERAGFTGQEIGILQSLREIPGFLSFAVIFLLVFLAEQPLALLALVLLGLGTALTGFFPTVIGLYVTTVVMSVGFHYFEALHQSLSLQWLDKERAPAVLGRIVSARSLAGLVAFGIIYLAVDFGGLAMEWVYLGAGGATALIAAVCWVAYPRFPGAVEQHKKLLLRKRYWLYYALVFMGGARRQIFTVFAGFMLVEKFGFSVATISLIYLANGVITMLTAPWIGRMIGRFGERRTLAMEYVGLIAVFAAYAVVENAGLAVALYIVDHMFFAMAIAQKTYFQKIADPADMAATAGVSFSINHIAAVVIPAAFGLIWVVSPAAVFLIGAAMAGVSLGLARLVPRHPEAGREVTWAPARLRSVPAAE
jgi:predicted MFS family arabinose efflux permease